MCGRRSPGVCEGTSKGAGTAILRSCVITQKGMWSKAAHQVINVTAGDRGNKRREAFAEKRMPSRPGPRGRGGRWESRGPRPCRIVAVGALGGLTLQGDGQARTGSWPGSGLGSKRSPIPPTPRPSAPGEDTAEDLGTTGQSADRHAGTC